MKKTPSGGKIIHVEDSVRASYPTTGLSTKHV